MSTAYVVALVVGLLSAFHCVGMCGGIVGALTWSLPAAVRGCPRRLFGYLLAFNLGRIGSYAVAGALFGWLGAALMSDGTLGGSPGGARAWVPELLRVLAALATVGIGLYIGGLFPRFAAVERIGAPLWRRLDPLGRRLLPVRSPLRAALYGAVWGWLPCGLVYTMLIGAPAQGSSAAGALYMALFGAGTLPTLLAGGLLAGRLYALSRDRRWQLAAGLAVVALGVSTLNFQGYNAGV